MAIDYDSLDVEVINEIINRKDPDSLSGDELEIYIEFYARAKANETAIREMKEANDKALQAYIEQTAKAAEMAQNMFNNMCDALNSYNEERVRLVCGNE